MIKAIYETLIMTFIPSIFSLIFGLILGSLLFLTKKGQILENKYIYYPTNSIVNFIRSFPFIIFVFVLIPITRFVVGTAFGPIAACFPISIVGITIYTRFVELAFYDINPGIIEASKTMGAKTIQIVYYFLLVEARSSLVLGFTSTIISIIAYTTVMGIVGGGGIGDLAINYGYYEYDFKFIFKMVFILSIIVFTIQMLGNYLAKKLDKKRRNL